MMGFRMFQNNTAEYQMVPVARIRRDERQPRTHFDDAGLRALADSLREHGMIQPIAVRPSGLDYIIVYGERRWRAAQLAELQYIPAIVRQPGEETAVDRFMAQVVENQYQTPLDPIDEGKAMVYVMENGGEDGGPISQAALALRWGRSWPYCDARITALQLPEAVQAMIRDGRWPVDLRATKALLSVPGDGARVALARELVERGATIPAIQYACRVAAARLNAQPVAQSPRRNTNGRTPEVVQVLAERETAVPESGPAQPWTTVRRVFADVCADCGWSSTAGVQEPAWVVVLEAFGKTCDACQDKLGGGLDTCRDCPAADALSRIVQGAKAQ